MKSIRTIRPAPRHGHWVGDGFPVRSLFSYQEMPNSLSPFLLLDYAGPYEFTAGKRPRGVGSHPHRGFETVTLVYQGEVAHKDSAGNGGVIGPGDVQWMTAGSGIVHEEFHSQAFSGQGGTLEMVQLWVNLPAKDKMTAPGYQAITHADIPVWSGPDAGAQVRVVAGEFDGLHGPAHTYSPLTVLDIRLAAGGELTLPVPALWNAAVVLLKGSVRLDNGETVQDTHLISFTAENQDVHLVAEADAMLLLLAGEPLNEQVVGYGPFVMSSKAEIEQAIQDFQAGRFA